MVADVMLPLKMNHYLNFNTQLASYVGTLYVTGFEKTPLLCTQKQDTLFTIT